MTTYLVLVMPPAKMYKSVIYTVLGEVHIYGYDIVVTASYYYRYSALGPVRAETRAQSGDWYGFGTLHPGQVLRGSFPLLSPAFRRSHFRHQLSPRPPRRERS